LDDVSARTVRPLPPGARAPLSSGSASAWRAAGQPHIDIRVAAVTWLVAWFAGQALFVLVLGATGEGDVDGLSIPILAVGIAATWSAYIAGMWAASTRAGSGRFVDDYRLRFAAVDLVGVPIGVLTQLVLVPLVYLPLRGLWPGTFTDDRLQETAKDLADRASGASVVLLVVMVGIGAPVVEELVYRGLLQGSLAARVNGVVAWLAASAWFALIHFRPVEYPGLLVFGLVAGACFLLTGRLGMAVATHVAFNVTGLVLAFE
jgi:membrane protease YdiL (CAAX protease family)